MEQCHIKQEENLKKVEKEIEKLIFSIKIWKEAVANLEKRVSKMGYDNKQFQKYLENINNLLKVLMQKKEIGKDWRR